MLAYNWKPVRIDGEPGAVFKCPKCGGEAVLGGEVQPKLDAGGHTMDAEGNVSPSVVCPFDPCDFHQFVTLVGWPEGPPSL